MNINSAPPALPTHKKLDRAYPLSHFQGYLVTHVSVYTMRVYLSAIRRLLGHLGEGTTGADGRPQHKTWLNEAAVKSYLDGLKYERHPAFHAAFQHWLTFTASPPTANTSERAARGAVACALRIILNARGQGIPPMALKDIPFLRWARPRRPQEKGWRLLDCRTSEAEYQLHPAVEPLMALIRAWGLCHAGDPFLPAQPASKVPMDVRGIRILLDNKASPALEQQIQSLAADADRTALVRLLTMDAPKPPKPPSGSGFRIPSKGIRVPDKGESEGYTVVGRGPNATIIYDRDPEYEDYVVPPEE